MNELESFSCYKFEEVGCRLVQRKILAIREVKVGYNGSRAKYRYRDEKGFHDCKQENLRKMVNGRICGFDLSLEDATRIAIDWAAAKRDEAFKESCRYGNIYEKLNAGGADCILQ